MLLSLRELPLGKVSVYQWKKTGRVLFPLFEHLQLLFWKTGSFVHESFVFFLSLQAPKWTRWRDVLLRCRLPFAAELKAQRFHKNDSLLWTGAIFTSEYCGYLYCTFIYILFNILWWCVFLFSFPIFSFAHTNFYVLDCYFSVALSSFQLLPRKYEHKTQL